jgi:hypothetical protein
MAFSTKDSLTDFGFRRIEESKSITYFQRKFDRFDILVTDFGDNIISIYTRNKKGEKFTLVHRFQCDNLNILTTILTKNPVGQFIT